LDTSDFGDFLKTIDHDPNEPQKQMLPDFDRTWEERVHGSKRTLWDALPWIVTVTALYFARVGWPF